MHAMSVSITLSLDRDASGGIRATADCPDFAMRAIADSAARALADLARLVESSPRAREWAEDDGSSVPADDGTPTPIEPAGVSPPAAPEETGRAGRRRRA